MDEHAQRPLPRRSSAVHLFAFTSLERSELSVGICGARTSPTTLLSLYNTAANAATPLSLHRRNFLLLLRQCHQQQSFAVCYVPFPLFVPALTLANVSFTSSPRLCCIYCTYCSCATRASSAAVVSSTLPPTVLSLSLPSRRVFPLTRVGQPVSSCSSRCGSSSAAIFVIFSSLLYRLHFVPQVPVFAPQASSLIWQIAVVVAFGRSRLAFTLALALSDDCPLLFLFSFCLF